MHGVRFSTSGDSRAGSTASRDFSPRPGMLRRWQGGWGVLLEDDGLRQRMGEQAAEDARKRFDIERQAAEYLGWYEWISCNLKKSTMQDLLTNRVRVNKYDRVKYNVNESNTIIERGDR